MNWNFIEFNCDQIDLEKNFNSMN